MGCLKALAVRVGCAVLLAAACLLVMLYHSEIRDYYRAWRGTAAEVWTAPVAGGETRARQALERLRQPGGPAWVDLTAGEAAAFLDGALSRSGARRVLDSTQVALLDGEIRVRGLLDLRGVPRSTLGPLAGVVGDRESASIGGPLSADSAGLVLTVTWLRLHDFPFPRATIPRILEAARIPGASGARVPLPGMTGIGDVRVSPSGLRLYRSSPR